MIHALALLCAICLAMLAVIFSAVVAEAMDEHDYMVAMLFGAISVFCGISAGLIAVHYTPVL